MTDTAPVSGPFDRLAAVLTTYALTEHGKRASLHAEIMRLVFDDPMRLGDALGASMVPALQSEVSRLRAENERLTGALNEATSGIIEVTAAINANNERLATNNAKIETLASDNAQLRATVETLHGALGFAASVIKSGETWTDTCQRDIGDVLTALKADAEGQK